MIVVPFVIGLIALIYVRPQEFYTPLYLVPWLHLFCALSLFGLLVGLRMRLVRPDPVPPFVWAALLFMWMVVTIAFGVPGSEAIGYIVDLMISLTLFLVIAQGVQSFRDLAAVAVVMVGLAAFLILVGIHQGLAPKGCLKLDEAAVGTAQDGTFDGRRCEVAETCLGPGAEPGADYACEHEGLFGTSSLDLRVRYRGVLEDPNELSMAIAAALPLLFALGARRRSFVGAAGVFLFLVAAAVCIVMTKSRSGQLVLGGVLLVYLVHRLRVRGVLIALAMAFPVVLLGGRSGADADRSTELRLEAWRQSLTFVKDHPILGIGQGMFSELHFLTAHNSFLLAAAELGLPGFFLWTAVVYISVKILIAGLWRFRHEPEAEPARTWGLALLASMTGILMSMAFLSLSYHVVPWIYLGLCGAYYSAVKSHRPDFQVSFGLGDALLVGLMCAAMLGGTEIFLRFKGA